ncbi:YSIRK-type signal peptide-containing protein [Haliscomenobacter hydrossis]
MSVKVLITFCLSNFNFSNHNPFIYSLRKLSTGLASAAFTD